MTDDWIKTALLLARHYASGGSVPAWQSALRHPAVKFAGKMAVPLQILSAGAHAGEGFAEDGIRGAGRGVLNSLDPSTLWLDKGYLASAYDNAFGAATPPEWNDLFDRYAASRAIKNSSVAASGLAGLKLFRPGPLPAIAASGVAPWAAVFPSMVMDHMKALTLKNAIEGTDKYSDDEMMSFYGKHPQE